MHLAQGNAGDAERVSDRGNLDVDGSSCRRGALLDGVRSRSAVSDVCSCRYWYSSSTDWTISTPIAVVGALVIWSFGRAARYVLGGR